jgi:hypothetical protein
VSQPAEAVDLSFCRLAGLGQACDQPALHPCIFSFASGHVYPINSLHAAIS